MKQPRSLSMRESHPWLRVIIGRCGSGKTTIAKLVMQAWRADRPDGDQSETYAVDPVATDPPGELHLAAESDVWDPEPPVELPPNVDLIAVDEADLSLYAGDARKKNPPPLHQLVRRRRHAGLSVLLLTQRPSLIDRSAWALADEIIICSCTDDADLKRIGKLPGIGPDELQRISTMRGPGIAVIWRPDEVITGVDDGQANDQQGARDQASSAPV